MHNMQVARDYMRLNVSEQHLGGKKDFQPAWSALRHHQGVTIWTGKEILSSAVSRASETHFYFLVQL